MAQTDLLTSVRLRIDPAARRGVYRPGLVVMRADGRTQQLVLTPAQASILQRGFEEPATVPEVLVRLLGDHQCPPLQEFYELVLQACAAGVLLEAEATPPPSLARRWWPRLKPSIALMLVRPLLLLAAGTLVVAPRPWLAPAWDLALLWGWLSACALLSLGEILAATVIAGGGGQVRAPRLHWLSVFPRFRVDTAEAALGGADCERTVALVRFTPVLAGAAAAAWFEPLWLAPLLAGVLHVLAPTRPSAARQLLAGLLGAKPFSVRAGFLFEPRRQDFWTRAKVWWSEQLSRLGLAKLGWAAGWTALVALVLQWCQPGVYRAIWRGFGPEGRFHVHLETALQAAIAIPAAGTLFLLWAMFRHWRMRRALMRPLRISQTHINTEALNTGDNPAALRSVPLFRKLTDDDLRALAAAMTPVDVARKEIVFREDDPGDAFYVVMAGEMEVLKNLPPPSRRKKTIGWLHPGDGFGEIALLDNANRTTTIRATRASRLLRLGKADFDQLVVGKMGGEAVRELLQNAAFLGRLTILGGWPFDDLMEHARRCRSQQFAAGAHVLRAGESNLWFYLIFDGAFEVRAGKKVLQRLHPGDYFGEISLLEHGTTTADVFAVEDSRCLVMSRADFLAFFARDYRIGLRIEALAAHRRGGQLFSSR